MVSVPRARSSLPSRDQRKSKIFSDVKMSQRHGSPPAKGCFQMLPMPFIDAVLAVGFQSAADKCNLGSS